MARFEDASEKRFALRELLERDELVRAMCLGDVARTQNDRRHTHPLKQARLGTVRYLSGRSASRESHRPLYDGIALGSGETDRLADPFEIDPGLRFDRAHLPRQLFCIRANFLIERIGRGLRQGAHIELELA